MVPQDTEAEVVASVRVLQRARLCGTSSRLARDVARAACADVDPSAVTAAAGAQCAGAPVTGDLAAELAKGYVRLNMAILVLLFGPDDARRQVERLYDGKLPADQAHAVREGLDEMARKWRQA